MMKRRSRDMETETEEELLLLVYPSPVPGHPEQGGKPTNPSPAPEHVIEEYIGDAPFAGLMKGSVGPEEKLERPKTLRKLRAVYDQPAAGVKMTPSETGGEERPGGGAALAGATTSGAAGSTTEKSSVLSPFDEQEEWAKISEIMASFGTIVRESVFVSELEKEFQERLGLNLNDSTVSADGSGITQVAQWLNSINFPQYESNFITFGYDSLDFINGVLDENDLKEMGVSSEEDRNTILEEAKSLKKKIAECVPLTDSPANVNINNNQEEDAKEEEWKRQSVEDWLKKLELSAYWETFRKHLYTEMDRVKTVWEVELAAVLEISKPGHRHRIMASLPRSPSQPTIQDINAELSLIKTTMQDLDNKVVSSSDNAASTPGPGPNNSGSATSSGAVSGTNAGNTGTLRHSHKKNRPAPQPPGPPKQAQQADLQIRDPSQLLVGVPSTITAQWRHQPTALLTGTLTYHARYLGSTVVKVLRGAESTKKSIQKMKKPLSEHNACPDIYLAISYTGVKFLSSDTKELVCEHEIRNIHLACQDAEDLTHFAYITKDRATKSHYCHVFSAQTMDQATEIILTLGQAFEVAYQLALREASSNVKGNGHTRSYSANLTPITTQPNHNRSHSVNEIKLNSGTILNGHSGNSVLMSEDI